MNITIDIFVAFDFVESERGLEFDDEDVTGWFVLVCFTEEGTEVFLEVGNGFHVFDDGSGDMLVVFVIHNDARGITIPN
ncbi:hypothetical protein, partial [Pseudomonas aeruginosa]|uniref:hypothetical protein n=1 Tax=Pseudomonas aeruginosa TaxID=287 RepID=UPI0011BE68D1